MVLGAEFRDVQAESADLTSQCDGTCGRLNMLVAERNEAAVWEVMVLGTLLAAEVARDSLS